MSGAPLDLDAICRRALDAATDEDAYFTRLGVLTDDVPALVAEVRRLRACRAIEQEALANALPILADAANVANAWNVAGRAPAHHRSMQAQLRKAWPTLARAVESLASR